ncbi:MAG: primase [Pseudonocardiales bacterium]|nr:primase [Pseudonocardiales bacterium]
MPKMLAELGLQRRLEHLLGQPEGALLYGLHEGSTANPSGRRPVVVEGPLDVLAVAARAHVTGDAEMLAVAACGTAFTITHARRVADVAFKHQAPVVVALDGDAAGRTAAVAAGEQLRYAGLDVRVAVLPNGTDPADYLTRQNSTLDVFRDTHALPLLTIRVQRAVAAQGDRMQWIEGRLAAARAIAGYLATYPVSYAAAQIGWIGNVLDLEAATFTFEVAAAYRQPCAPPNGARPAALINPLDSDHAEPGRRTYEREVIT